MGPIMVGLASHPYTMSRHSSGAMMDELKKAARLPKHLECQGEVMSPLLEALSLGQANMSP